SGRPWRGRDPSMRWRDGTNAHTMSGRSSPVQDRAPRSCREMYEHACRARFPCAAAVSFNSTPRPGDYCARGGPFLQCVTPRMGHDKLVLSKVCRIVMQPLTGLFVLDFTTLLPGPLATLMLAEAGAEVLKIEQPGGENARRFPPFVGKESAAFTMLNRGKTSIALDLKSGADRDKVMPFIKRADILVEQFRPGVMDRLGFGYDDLKKINPGLIYCSISGYRQSRPRVQEDGHDINSIGTAGLLDLQPGPADHPIVPPMLAADIAGGSFPAVINILLALRARDQSGQGCRIDIAMTDAMFTFTWAALAI